MIYTYIYHTEKFYNPINTIYKKGNCPNGETRRSAVLTSGKQDRHAFGQLAPEGILVYCFRCVMPKPESKIKSITYGGKHAASDRDLI